MQNISVRWQELHVTFQGQMINCLLPNSARELPKPDPPASWPGPATEEQECPRCPCRHGLTHGQGQNPRSPAPTPARES